MAKASRVSTLIDVADAVTLRDITDGAETSTATETAISLSELDAAYWHNGEIPHGVFEVFVNVTALDTTTGDETYTISLLADDTSDLSNSPTTVYSQVIKATGVYKFLLDSKTIAALDTESSGADKWLGIKATLAGTTPSITYGAWIGRKVSQ